MVGFRNNVGSGPLTRWVSPSSQQIAFARGMIYTTPFILGRERSHATGYIQVPSASWPSTTRMAHGTQHSRRACPWVRTATSWTVRPKMAPAAERRTWKEPSLASQPIRLALFWFRRFQIGLNGSLTVTVGPRQAIAVHTGAMGIGLPTPEPAQQVSVLFSETATTSYGEVSALCHHFHRPAR
jgi:hypothetical protein